MTTEIRTLYGIIEKSRNANLGPYLKKLIQEQKEKESERVSREFKSLLKKVTSKKKKGRQSRVESKYSKSPRLNGSHSKRDRKLKLTQPKHKEDMNESDTLSKERIFISRRQKGPGNK